VNCEHWENRSCVQLARDARWTTQWLPYCPQRPVEVQLKGARWAHRVRSAMCLSGPKLDAKDGVALAKMKVPAGSAFSVPRYSAFLLLWS